MTNLLDDVNELLEKKIGDEYRLRHIKKTLEKNTILYASDREFLSNLCKIHLNQHAHQHKTQQYLKPTKESDDQLNPKNENILGNEHTVENDELDVIEKKERNNFCTDCGNKILESAQFCTNCGKPA
jgi:hypothetical protein